MRDVTTLAWFEFAPELPVVVHVWAPWNHGDRVMESLLSRSSISERVYSLNSDEEVFWPLLRASGVMNLPALLVFRNGASVRTIQNQALETMLEEAVRDLAALTGG